MKNTNTAMWGLGAVLLAVVIGIAAYFLLISPELDKTGEARDSLESAQSRNDQLEQQIRVLEGKTDQVATWQEELDAIAVDLPPLPELSDFHRLLVDALEARKLPVVGLTYGGPSIVEVPQQGGTGTEAPATDPTASAEPSATPSPDATPTPPTPVEPLSPLIEFPVSISTEGSPESIMSLLKFLSTQDDRFFTVTNFDITRGSESDATAGRPKINDGDWVVTVTGRVFSLLDDVKSFPVDEEGPNPVYSGNGFKNTFAPLPGE